MQAMKRTTLIAAACAVLIAATGFAAAAPGSAPVSVDEGVDSTDEANGDEREDRSENGAAAGGAADERNGQGPPSTSLIRSPITCPRSTTEFRRS